MGERGYWVGRKRPRSRIKKNGAGGERPHVRMGRQTEPVLPSLEGHAKERLTVLFPKGSGRF